MRSSQAILNEIAADNLSGAAAIYIKAIKYFRVIISENCNLSSDRLNEILLESGRALLHVQSEMAPLYNLVATIITAMRVLNDAESKPDRINKLLNKLEHEQQISVKQMVNRTIRYVPERTVILTISYSSAFGQLMAQHPARESLTVIIPESRPMCEGIDLARKLDEIGMKTVLITDFAVGNYLDKADIFICGADAVTESFIVNKIGTGLLSKMMKEQGRNTISLFAETKLIKDEIFKFSPELHPPSEITSENLNNCSVENRYFEKCPLQNFTHLISDKKLYTPDSLRKELANLSYPDDLI